MKKSRFLTNISLYLRNDASQSRSYYRMRIKTVLKLSNGVIPNDIE